jgi:hypothetical protein
LISEAARDTQAAAQEKFAEATPARGRQNIHLAQLAHLEGNARKRRDARAAHDLTATLDHEIHRTRCRVRLRHQRNFRIRRGSTAACAALGHGGANDLRECGIVG